MKNIKDLLLIYLPASFLLISVGAVIAFDLFSLHYTPTMLKRQIEHIGDTSYKHQQDWVDITEVDPLLLNAIIYTEDQKFWQHNGFDFSELFNDYEQHRHLKRGYSTISQQVAKNCFTFGTHTYIRKALEAYYTLLIELFWSKSRILEVYINIAETGNGLFGVQTALQHYFDTNASNVTEYEAAAIACMLPNPIQRTPQYIASNMSGKVTKIMRHLNATQKN